ncbi:MAG: putative lipid II flippase FtsW [Gammaproteobacteria bacterium]|jgi:cell division protein FtsW|nr:putative lipid II flippase FtsW [Gammaproteobacteria bacterium]
MTGMRKQAYRREDRVRQLRPDAGIIMPTVLLCLIGVVMVGSASIAVAEANGVEHFYYLLRHLMFLGLAVLIAVLLRWLPMARLEASSRILLVPIVLLLLLPMLPGIGVEVNGSQRWINLGVARFQTVEMVKLLLIIYLAGYLNVRSGQLGQRFMETVKPLLLAGLLTLILLQQPDFGSAMVLAAIVVTMLFMAGTSIWYLMPMGLLSLPLLGLAAIEPYRLQRIMSFRDPFADAFGSGYQLSQALIAIGRGELFGVGIGASIQKLFYLPEAHTDFIFAVLAEETGLLGIIVVMALYCWLIMRIMIIGRQAHGLQQGFMGYLCWGIGIWLALQALISMGVNLGLLPTKGLTLPLISSGGSSLLMTLAAIAIVVRVKLEIERLRLQRPSMHADWLSTEVMT